MTRTRATTRFGAALTLAAALAAPARGETVALLPVQDRAGDAAVAREVAATLAEELAARHDVLDAARLRDALRRRRIRSVDDTPPAELMELAAELGADRFVTVVVHLAEREVTPRLALSARSYDGATGELVWAGFESGSGLDGRTVLGLGVVGAAEELAERLTRRLARELAEAPAVATGRAADLGVVAIVPLSGLAETDATRAAETVTEIARAALIARGVRVLSPNRVFQALYTGRGAAPIAGWGVVDAVTRRALCEAGADLVLTGSVERWGMAGDGLEPEPLVTVALRVLDATSGRIVWTGALERRGWDHQAVFRLGRIHDHGSLAERMVDRLTTRLTKDLAAGALRFAASTRTTP
jgi:hypothetical protein